MNCLSCHKEIPDSKRMCDECVRAMITRLVEAKEGKSKKSRQEQSWNEVIPPEAPKGVVKAWKPTKKKLLFTGTLPSADEKTS